MKWNRHFHHHEAAISLRVTKRNQSCDASLCSFFPSLTFSFSLPSLHFKLYFPRSNQSVKLNIEHAWKSTLRKQWEGELWRSSELWKIPLIFEENQANSVCLAFLIVKNRRLCHFWTNKISWPSRF